jgi:mRNA interferase YafQ
MRQIELLGTFKRDYKRELKGRYKECLEADLSVVATALAKDQPLARHYRDHALSGNWSNFFSCHIKPDLILIYRRVGADSLHLIRLGSHSELRL